MKEQDDGDGRDVTPHQEGMNELGSKRYTLSCSSGEDQVCLMTDSFVCVPNGAQW